MRDDLDDYDDFDRPDKFGRRPVSCLGCDLPISTWAEQKRQFARAIKAYGLTPAQAKQAMPRCQKCTTELLSPRHQHR
jgi:hypothetical protein